MGNALSRSRRLLDGLEPFDHAPVRQLDAVEPALLGQVRYLVLNELLEVGIFGQPFAGHRNIVPGYRP